MNNYPLYQHPPITNLKQLVAMCAKDIPKGIAFQDQEKQKNVTAITFRQFQQDLEALGTFFRHRGLSGAKVAVLGENSYFWILTYFAVVLSSNVIVPVDKELPDNEIDSLLRRCGAKALVYASSFQGTAESMRKKGAVDNVFSMREFSSFLETGRELLRSGFPSILLDEVDENAVCSLIFTSGTTGKPKGVMLTQRNLMADTVASCKSVWIPGSSVLTLPLHHTFAFTANVLVTLLYKHTICINKSLRTFLSDLTLYQPRTLFLVPLYMETMYQGIWKAAKEQKKDKLLKRMIVVSNVLRKWGIDLRKELFRSVHTQFGGNLELIVSGGAFLEQKYIDGMEELGIQVLNGYGITECSPVVAVNRNQYRKKGSVGLPLSCCEIQIIEGEICVRGELVMAGYFQDPTATLEALQDGWFHTGDLGYLDEEGFLYLTGRRKNLIILSNGKNVSAEELESKIMAISHVLEVLVYGEEDTITAEIFAEEDTGIREGIQALNRELPAYKRIQRIKFRTSAFEKTTTKKIKRS